MADYLEIRRPDDFHVHLRRGAVLKKVVAYTTHVFKRALVMPNTDPPILTAQDALVYKAEILNTNSRNFEPLMTIQLTDNTTQDMVQKASEEAAVVAGKIYPQGVTTNSSNGVTDFDALYPVFERMAEIGMVLSIHGQMPGKDIYYLDREEKFLPVLEQLAEDFPKLKIVMEHLSTSAAVLTVLRLGQNVAATITAHHMVLTGNDFADGAISPHNFCIPPAQRAKDREALIDAATGGYWKFFFGSDSAPHLILSKECRHGKGGIFSAPVALPLLAQIFEARGRLDRLENFVAGLGASFYGRPLNEGVIKLVKAEWDVPMEVSGIVPFMSCKPISWNIAD